MSKCDQNNGQSGFRLYLGAGGWLTGQQKYQSVLWHFLGCNQLPSLSYQGRDSHLGRSLHGCGCHKQCPVTVVVCFFVLRKKNVLSILT